MTNGLVPWYDRRNLRASILNFGIGRILVIALVLGLVLWLAISRWQLHRERSAHENAELRADSLEAVNDVSRRAVLSAADAMRILGDSLQAMERRGVQLAGGVKTDAFDRATGRTSVVRGGVTVTPSAIVTTTTSSQPTRVDSVDVRIAVFHVDSSGARAGPRYVADARVEVPAPPRAASLALGVRLLPIALSTRIQCGEAVNGIRPASMAVIGPTGYNLEVEPLQLNARVCNEDFGRPKGLRIPIGWAGGLAAVTFGLGVLVGSR
jgi:hypothetical protein